MREKRSIKSLIIAELDGDITNAERARLLQWMSQSDRNARYYTKIKDLWESSVADVAEMAQTTQEWERFKNRINTTRPAVLTIRRRINWSLTAAVVAIGLLVGSLIMQNYKQKVPVYLTTIAPKGSVSQTILPDGTLIYLNAGSEIKYDVNETSKKREVFVTGEAWFDVKRNEKKPFIVHTPYYNVEVLGTQFNVKNYEAEHRVVTTLEKGSIRILSSDHLMFKEEIVLKPGEQLVFDKIHRKIQRKEHVDTHLYTSWKDNKLIFLDMLFGDLIKLLERKYDIEIEVVDQSILNEHYTGTIRNETILEVFEIIKHTHPIEYHVEERKIIIQKKVKGESPSQNCR
ncbi:FecR family protein [uncultured Sunxiuqinia sp.]|uniref:FecR family protein n=1 Tax=Sunxiuqinia rutila TaxID=1397841 RepID=UPI002625529C|nr:FecR domain-containing protein [uncultured Sunxiuqinia sp.]